jgi:hypothetical protein
LSVVCNSAIARQDAINNDLTVSEADRKIDTATHLVKIVTTVTIENGGKSSAGYFLVPVDNSLKNYLSYFGASVSNGDDLVY